MAGLGEPGGPECRALYLVENLGVETVTPAVDPDARTLFLYENRGVEVVVPAVDPDARALYLVENRGIEALVALARSLYLYEEPRDGEVFPWLEKIDPTEQYRGGQVDLYGDGFGELVEVAAGATITTSSVDGGYVGGNTVDRTAAEWRSTDDTGAWIRFAFESPQTIVGVAIEDRVWVPVLGVGDTDRWGVPLFRFSDGGADVVGSSAIPAPVEMTAEYPVGAARTLYAISPARTTSYVEIRVSSAGAGPKRGLSEVWIFADQDQAAETSSSILNDTLPEETTLGIVAWSNRSPGLWPANSGLPETPAAIVTIPPEAVSGLVIVEEDA